MAKKKTAIAFPSLDDERPDEDRIRSSVSLHLRIYSTYLIFVMRNLILVNVN
jgi:hypothetical protein